MIIKVKKTAVNNANPFFKNLTNLKQISLLSVLISLKWATTKSLWKSETANNLNRSLWSSTITTSRKNSWIFSQLQWSAPRFQLTQIKQWVSSLQSLKKFGMVTEQSFITFSVSTSVKMQLLESYWSDSIPSCTAGILVFWRLTWTPCLRAHL